MRKTALEAHEQLCEQRYSEINRRLNRIETEISSVIVTAVPVGA